jgi:hypothetical protein
MLGIISAPFLGCSHRVFTNDKNIEISFWQLTFLNENSGSDFDRFIPLSATDEAISEVKFDLEENYKSWIGKVVSCEGVWSFFSKKDKLSGIIYQTPKFKINKIHLVEKK